MSTDKGTPISSTGQGAGEVRHSAEKTKQQHAELVRDDRQDSEGAIPDAARDDFTFPDEDKTLGRRTGDDLPGERAEDRR